MIDQKEPDWASIIKRLSKLGMTHETIADKVGVSKHAISSLSCGRSKTTAYTTGRILLELLDRQEALIRKCRELGS